MRQGAFADARVHLDQALGLLSDPGARLDAHRDRAFAAFAGGGMRDARHVVTDVLGELRGRDDDARCRSRPTWRCWPGCPATSTSWT